MLTKLHLKNFKSFKDADLTVGPFSLLIGTNASGKSNIRDALRFLHGIGRGYSLVEILGEKYGEGGELQWHGIRGGMREIAYENLSSFALTVQIEKNYQYAIEVDIDKAPRVVRENLSYRQETVFDYEPCGNSSIVVMGRERLGKFMVDQPLLTQIRESSEVKKNSNGEERLLEQLEEVTASLRSLRFLDLHPDAMRWPSLPHQTVLGDRGENLSSVLQTICTNSPMKEILIQWLQALTPMDAKDFEFLADYTGRILIHLLENNGRTTSAYSASDGTLRFLAMMAALLGPKAATLYFFEELENGIHPNRLYLLIELIENYVKLGKTQLIATTHSPNLLGFAGQETLQAASLIYRLPDQTESRIQRIVDIPEIQQFIEAGEMARLHESGWFENVVAFTQDVGHED